MIWALSMVLVLISGQTPADPQKEPTFSDLIEIMSVPHGEGMRLLEDLLEGGVDANLLGDNGRTLLHVAVMMGNIDPIKILLAAGADPNRADNEGKTPLQYVTPLQYTGKFNRDAIISVLVDYGAEWPEADLPKQFYDIEKTLAGLLEEKERLEGGMQENRDELQKMAKLSQAAYYGMQGRSLRNKQLDLYDKLFDVDKQIGGTDKAIETGIEQHPDFQEKILRRHRHRMTADIFVLSWKDIHEELRLKTRTERIIVRQEIERRLAGSVLRAENMKVLRKILEYLCEKPNSCKSKIDEILGEKQ